MAGLDGPLLTLGAMLAGCMSSVGLSAIVGFQTFLYFRIFHGDTRPYKILVAWIWITDAGHTIAVCTTIWQYVVLSFTNSAKLEQIVPAYPVNVLITVIATLNANLFYTWRIHKMSKRNWWLTTPMYILCFARTVLGLFTAIEMFMTKRWDVMAAKFSVALVSAWAVSAATDVIISAARYYYLHDFSQGYMATKEMVDAVVIFTINDGILTCATVIAAIACFLAMPRNFVYIGLYFNLTKLFSNSVLATLNLRSWYRHRLDRPMGIPLTRPTRATLQMPSSTDKSLHASEMQDNPGPMEVFVDQQVEYNVAVDKYMEGRGDSHSRS
ncbi:hypothetical protein K438DRAFT_2026765 [Mycena galopus ATCC 62051]|nr:hypothetical protein K438DRAFT_2026765 [Mycena galopus ATCC 62051]